MGKTRKYYVVWQGLHPGVYNNWEDCKEQVEGQSGAKYKAFESREAAEEAFANGYESYIQKNPTPKMVFEKMMKEKEYLSNCIKMVLKLITLDKT